MTTLKNFNNLVGDCECQWNRLTGVIEWKKISPRAETEQLNEKPIEISSTTQNDVQNLPEMIQNATIHTGEP